jgi:hypothetical protein
MFPAAHILAGFRNVERSLMVALAYVPHCPAHGNVWSPPLADVTINASHHLDSLWKATAHEYQAQPAGNNHDIRDYFRYFGPAGGGCSIAQRWVLFWGEQPVQLRPFASWDAGTYARLSWWAAYTKLKHDRWRNIREGTLGAAVDAVAALFLAIVRCEFCRDAVAEAGWLSSKPTWESMNPSHSTQLTAWLLEDATCHGLFIAAESELFSYPVGWWNRTINASDEWRGTCSLRFRTWFNAQGS